MIAVGVVVPARDEQDHVAACLLSVRLALQRLPAGIASAVTVVLDRCGDRTPQRVAALIAGWPQAEAVCVTAGPGTPIGAGEARVGALRDLGLRQALFRLGAHPPRRTWLLSTDADTTVPSDWAVAHLRHAAAGAHAVAGLAELAGAAHLSAHALDRYRAHVASRTHGARHEHVYGANLGVRADAYLAVGGFPSDGAGEDHGLWRRLHAAGYRLEQPPDPRVRTSARMYGRAAGGLADLLRSLHLPRPDGVEPVKIGASFYGQSPVRQRTARLTTE